ncbi:MAG: ABC transporter permease [Acidimicrobiales bacterium]
MTSTRPSGLKTAALWPWKQIANRPAIRYVLRRLVTSVALIFVLSAIIFFSIQRIIPGTEAVILAGSLGDSPAQVRAVEKHLGLLKPITSQYADWLVKALHGNFGTSPISGLKISSVIAQQAPVSIELALFGLLIATLLGVPIGALAALWGRQSPRRDMLVRLPFLIFYALPFFVSGAILLLLSSRFFPSIYTAAYVPITSDLGANLRSMILPAIAVGLPVSGNLVQMTRATMAEVLSQPFVTTARGNGLAPLRLYGVYALKAASLPILSLEGFSFGILISGVVVVEDVFSLPGIGRGLLLAIENRDFLELEAQVLVLVIAFIVGNLLVDLISPLVDRRITVG